MKPLGEVQLNVSKGPKQYSLKFQVVEGNMRPLLSAETCHNLGLLTITIDGHVSENVHTVQDTQSPLLTKNEILHKCIKMSSRDSGTSDKRNLLLTRRSSQCNTRQDASLSRYTKKSKRN